MERDEGKKKILQQLSVEASQQLSHQSDTIDRSDAMVQEQHRIKHPRSFYILWQAYIFVLENFSIVHFIKPKFNSNLKLNPNLALSVILTLIYPTTQP